MEIGVVAPMWWRMDSPIFIKFYGLLMNWCSFSFEAFALGGSDGDSNKLGEEK
jgi:hypothetical protein